MLCVFRQVLAWDVSSLEAEVTRVTHQLESLA